jgi:uncharacterized protein YecT (DUF1311 family)
MPRDAPVMRMVLGMGLLRKKQIEPAAAGAQGRTFVYSFRRGRPSETRSLFMRLSALAFCAMLSAVPAAYAEAAYAEECQDQTQSGLDVCADKSYKKADAALNGVYKDITHRLKDDAATAKLLVQAQKAWLTYRDAECAFSSSASAGGSIYPMVLALCLEAVTEERTRDLRVFLKCDEGDMGCPVPAP